MKSGDLIRPIRAGLDSLKGVAYLDIWTWDNPHDTTDHAAWAGKWRHDQVGILLEGRREVSSGLGHTGGYVMLEVLLDGNVKWVLSDEVEAIDETG